ncbi:hypothetical protein [Treponema sp. C6A8]|uniref:hypothetical protein n=1 Tax=Treponema sp. C6A8 TaxID=1410609 RepID=UPI000483C408|nr:hypothetical protein [Treponema sp. C6A8]
MRKLNKKVLSIIFAFSASLMLFAEKYQISDVEYETEGAFGFGKTNPYSLSLNVEVDKKRVFETEAAFLHYKDDYIQRLKNTRLFSKIEVDYAYDEEDENGIRKVHLSVHTVDSIHILAFPYPKYDSNKGFTMKIKGKDNNFLGSMNEMAGELNFSIKDSSSEDSKNKIGLGFSYDHPFKAGPFNATWINDYSFSYNFDESSPEWDAKSGLKLSLPFPRHSFVWEFDQSFIKNLDYSKYDDDLYFKEYFNFSVPIKVAIIDDWGNVTYTPSTSVTYNWDFDGIQELNTDLSSPVLSIGHTLATSRINWADNLRNGLSISLGNSYSYNTQRYTFTPKVETELQAFKSFYFDDMDDVFARMGLAADFYAFYDIQDPHGKYIMVNGSNIGSRLRGIRDDLKYDDTDYKMCNVISAFVLNLDMPIHFFTSTFETKVLNKLNVDVQISPFVDIALTHNKITDRWFDPRDGFYCGGLEVLIYPLKWSGFVFRISAGIDMARTVLKKLKMPIENDWRSGSKYELSIGLGLQY